MHLNGLACSDELSNSWNKPATLRKCRKSVEITGRQRAAVGRKHEAKAPNLLALGREGQQWAPAKTGSNPYLPAISKAPNRITIRGFFVSGNLQALVLCLLVSGLNPNQQAGAVPALAPTPRPKCG